MRDRLFAQTVTAYHGDAAARTVTRTVLRGVSWQHGIRRTPAADGTRQGDAMLLVVPEKSARWGTDYTLEPGDRLCAGVGPELTWDQWQTFVPAARDDVAVVAYVLPLTLGGRAHHLEAGAWWNGGGTGAHSLTN